MKKQREAQEGQLFIFFQSLPLMTATSASIILSRFLPRPLFQILLLAFKVSKLTRGNLQLDKHTSPMCFPAHQPDASCLSISWHFPRPLHCQAPTTTGSPLLSALLDMVISDLPCPCVSLFDSHLRLKCPVEDDLKQEIQTQIFSQK